MAEARRAEREIINFYLQVFDRTGDRLLGYLADVTPAGLMLQSRESIPEGKDFDLRLEFNGALEGYSGIDLKGRSIWTRKEKTSIFFHNGFELQEVDEEQRRLIETLMENFKLSDNNQETG